MAIMTVSAYARHRGVDRFSVQTAIKRNRISTLPDGRIDSDVADREWEENTVARPPMVTGNRRRGEDDGDGDSFGASQYTKARAVREHYQARLAKLEFEEKTGKLVDSDSIKVAAFNLFRQFRDGMLGIPDRVSAMVAAESEEARVHRILTDEIRKALNDFADSDR